jgi:hypothetical protein
MVEVVHLLQSSRIAEVDFRHQPARRRTHRWQNPLSSASWHALVQNAVQPILDQRRQRAAFGGSFALGATDEIVGKADGRSPPL